MSYGVEAWSRGAGVVMLSVSGTLDGGVEPAPRDCLDAFPARSRVLLVDLHRVSEMDVHGLLLLLDLHREAERQGLRVTVTGWQPQPRRVMAQVAG
ncbi:STAS domain-containing protein [Streptomyces sp. H27-G5]|nr:STAS domain-containing protein [Streptomyces sp. H27-G5]